MTAALFILSACLWTTPPPADAVRAGGGFIGLLPAATLRAEIGAGERVAVTARYDTAAGMAHDLGLGARVHFGPWRAEFEAAHGFFSVEELGGIVLANAPFGQGLTTLFGAAYALHTARGHAVFFEGGLTARWTRLEDDFGTRTRVFEPTLHTAHLGLGVDWTGGLFLRVRAVAPVQAELKVLGYYPHAFVGYAWPL